MQELKVNLRLDNLESHALIRMSDMDCRLPREQLRYILREEAKRRGLLDNQVATERQIEGSSDKEGTQWEGC
jgi:hypothetical protein